MSKDINAIMGYFRGGGEIQRCINNGLRKSIADHGPITRENMNSATKRILGELKVEIKNTILEP